MHHSPHTKLLLIIYIDLSDAILTIFNHMTRIMKITNQMEF